MDYYTELKFYKSARLTTSALNKMARKLYESAELDKNKKGLLIVNSIVNDNDRRLFVEKFNVEIIDLENLLYLTNNNINLSRELESLVKDTVVDLRNVSANDQFNLSKLFVKVDSNEQEVPTLNQGIDYKARLVNLDTGRPSFRKYEILCTEILQYLFRDNLNGWNEQNSTVDGLNRMDLICRIKRGNEFWDLIKEEFHSRYIIFEFKNYTDEIKQTQIYTTEKYLFNTALRTVCFLVSREGVSVNAMTAIEGILRETGKLIIPLSDNDMINMIDIKEDDLLPEDYLFDLLDNIMMKLSK